MVGTTQAIEVIFFDLGHTLIYFEGDLNEALAEGAHAMLETLRARGYALDAAALAPLFLRRLQEYYFRRDQTLIETPTSTLLREFLRSYGHPEPAPADLAEALAALYAPTEARWQPEADALPTLDTLRRRGYRMGLISNAGDAADVQRLVDRAGLRPLLDHIFISAEVGWRKPHPAIFTHALHHFGVKAPQAVMVGDLLWADVWGAQRVGMRGIWLTRHSGPTVPSSLPEPVQPDAALERLSDLPALLETWQNRPPA